MIYKQLGHIGGVTLTCSNSVDNAPVMFRRDENDLVFELNDTIYTLKLTVQNSGYTMTTTKIPMVTATTYIELNRYLNWSSDTAHIGVYIMSGSRTMAQTSFDCILLQGKSYPFRSEVVTFRYLLDGQSTFEFYAPQSGNVSNGSTTTTVDVGINTLPVSTYGGGFTYNIGAFSGVFDDSFDYTFDNEGLTVTYSVECEKQCAINDNSCVVEFNNYRGEKCHLLGYTSNIANELEAETYRAYERFTYRKGVTNNVISNGQTITCTFPLVRFRSTYPQDILLNDTVKLTINDREYECVPEAQAIERQTEIADIEITFTILK